MFLHVHLTQGSLEKQKSSFTGDFSKDLSEVLEEMATGWTKRYLGDNKSPGTRGSVGFLKDLTSETVNYHL